MSDEVEELVGRLVVGRKRDGRKVFDEGVKAELVALCARSGASVSKLARECDLNANQLSRWIREHEQGRQRAVVARSVATREAFVAYFSDRGRLFQSEGGRRFSAMADGVSI